MEQREQDFLEEIAKQCGFTGTRKEVFLLRCDRQNEKLANKELIKQIPKIKELTNPEQSFQDYLTSICEDFSQDQNFSLASQKKRGRPSKGEEPWRKVFDWLWDTKYPQWQPRTEIDTPQTDIHSREECQLKRCVLGLKGNYQQAQLDAIKFFVARKKEQEQFKKTLHYLLNISSNQVEPTLLIINSNGGMGKSSLINQFQLIAKEEELEINPKPLIIKIDWDDHNISKNLPEQDKAIKLMDLITFYFPNEYQQYFSEYQQTRDQYTDILKRKAEYQQNQNPSNLTDESLKIDSNFLQKINQEKDAFNRDFRNKLSSEEQLIFDDPKCCLSRLFVNSLLTLSSKHPLVLLLDTVETILDIKYLYSGLIKYTIPRSKNILLVLAGRISREVETSIRNTLEDIYLYKAELETFSVFDIKDYFIQRFNQSEESISESFVKKLYEITDGIPIAVEMIATAFAQDEQSLNSFQDINKENLDTDEICGKVAHRFLKYCLDDEKTKDRDYIYTLAILHNTINNIPQVCNFIWQQLFPSSITTEEIISRLQREYSFINNGKIHPVVKNFVCSALKIGTISTGRLFDINQQALNYFASKIGSYKEFSRKIRNNDYQKALIGKLNHHLWSRNPATDTLEFLTEIYSLSIRYGELEFAIDFLNLVTEDKLFRSQLSNQDNQFLTDLQVYGTYIKPNSDFLSPSVLALKEAIIERLNNWEAKSQNLILEASALVRSGNYQKALELAKQVENLIQHNNDYSEDLGDLYLIMGVNSRREKSFDNAIIYLEKANKFYSKNNPMVFIELARINQQICQIAKSREFYQKALTLNPSLEFARQEMISFGQNYEKQIDDPLEHEIEQCLKFLQEISESTHPKKYYKRHSRLSQLLMQQGKLHNALESRLIAENGFSDLACTYNKSSTLYLLLGDENKALEKAQKALQIMDNNQQDNLGSYLALGDVYRILKEDNEKAREYYGKVISNLQNKNQDRKSLFLQKEAYYRLGLTLLLDKQIKEGYDKLDLAAQLVEDNDDLSDDAQVFNALGIAFLLNKAPRRASEYFEKALIVAEKTIHNRPSDYESYYSKMIALIGLHRQEEANNTCEIALRNCHAKGVLKMALEKLNLIENIQVYSEEVRTISEYINEYLV